MTLLPILDRLAEIRRLYFGTTRRTIDRDFAKALELLKGMPSEEEREKATVYMHGLAQMRADWSPSGAGRSPAGKSAPRRPRGGRRT